MDELRPLFTFTGLVLFVEGYCWWKRPRWYDRYGIPVFRATRHLASKPVGVPPTAFSLQIVQPSTLWGYFDFHTVNSSGGKHRIGVRERLGWSFTHILPMMHGVIDVDEAARTITFIGYANYLPMAVGTLFIVQFLVGELQPDLAIGIAFLFGAWVVIQVTRFRTLLNTARRAWQGKPADAKAQINFKQ